MADLRTIQKDLFDQQVLVLPPSRYGTLHRSLLAVTEGGDFEPRDLLALEPEVRTLLEWAARRYDAPTVEEEPESGSLFDRLIREISVRTSGGRHADLQTAVMTMWLLQNTDHFAKAVASFLLVLGTEPAISDDLMTELLEQASI